MEPKEKIVTETIQKLFKMKKKTITVGHYPDFVCYSYVVNMSQGQSHIPNVYIIYSIKKPRKYKIPLTIPLFIFKVNLTASQFHK